MLPIAVTVGEPSGIGPDILVKLAAKHRFKAPLVFVANRELLEQRARQIGENFNLPDFDSNKPSPISLLDVAHNNEFVLETLKIATAGCLAGKFSAMVTAPVNKAIIQKNGVAFSGHTEYLAQLTDTAKAVMLFVYRQVRLALLTTHIPLNTVASHITPEKITRTLQILHRSLIQQFTIANPKILVTGLNPHAGEQGCLGTEEQEIIIPTIDKLRQQGLNISDPVAADTALQREGFDAILSMYHDQLLPAIKTLGFGEVVNVTLGLPFIRTSVDHGTACELAGTGKANESSLVSAINLAITLS